MKKETVKKKLILTYVLSFKDDLFSRKYNFVSKNKSLKIKISTVLLNPFQINLQKT